MNHSRFAKEDRLPDWERRDNKVTKGDRAEDLWGTFTTMTRSILLITRNLSDKSFIENQNTDFMLNPPPPQTPRKSCCFRDKSLQYHKGHTLCMPDNLDKNKDTLIICNNYCFSTAKMLIRKCLMSRYPYSTMPVLLMLQQVVHRYNITGFLRLILLHTMKTNIHYIYIYIYTYIHTYSVPTSQRTSTVRALSWVG